MGELILLRHGETEWSRTGRHTGLTDVPLTPAGEAAAAALAPMLAGRDIRCTCASPLQRAARTAALAGLADVKQDPDLREWDYGGYERELELPTGYGRAVEASLGNGQLAIRVLRGDAIDKVTVTPAPL